ncbi:hypothetical protein BCEN4_370176 [Burkholderia cenocepacia]|nr:hypothetical protein BCEN4_370176 [Burkholderia cenocepacia]
MNQMAVPPATIQCPCQGHIVRGSGWQAVEACAAKPTPSVACRTGTAQRQSSVWRHAGQSAWSDLAEPWQPGALCAA